MPSTILKKQFNNIGDPKFQTINVVPYDALLNHLHVIIIIWLLLRRLSGRLSTRSRHDGAGGQELDLGERFSNSNSNTVSCQNVMFVFAA